MPRPYRIDPGIAHWRAGVAARSRTGADYHIRKLTETAATLTGEQKRRLAELVMPFLAEPGRPGGGQDGPSVPACLLSTRPGCEPPGSNAG